MLISAIAKQYKAYSARSSADTFELPQHTPVPLSSPEPELAHLPGPTPEEQRVLDDDGKPKPLELLKRENWPRLALLLFILTIFILVNLFEKPIIHALEPASRWMHRTPGAWAIPIAILVALSIPPLFGHEIVLMIIGLTWGPGIGMAIGAGGTILGEIGTFYLFKYVLQRRAAKYEEKNVKYAVLAHVLRQGGIKVATVARWSVIPNHMLTALFATCGISFTTFLVSAVLSLPNTFVNIYLGYALGLQADGQSTKTSRIVNDVDIAVVVIVTIAAGRYMRYLQNNAKGGVILARRQRRWADLESTESRKLNGMRPYIL